jgi:hypothetical protein
VIRIDAGAGRTSVGAIVHVFYDLTRQWKQSGRTENDQWSRLKRFRVKKAAN